MVSRAWLELQLRRPRCRGRQVAVQVGPTRQMQIQLSIDPHGPREQHNGNCVQLPLQGVLHQVPCAPPHVVCDQHHAAASDLHVFPKSNSAISVSAHL